MPASESESSDEDLAGAVAPAAAATEGTPVDGVGEKSPCTDRWTNLANESQKKMWGVFEETGIFVGACRHGVVMAICDMIRSGEL